MDTQIIVDKFIKSFFAYPDEYQKDDCIDGRELWSFGFQNKYAENAITVVLAKENYIKWYGQNYRALLDVSKAYGVWVDSTDTILNYLEEDRSLILNLENFYIKNVSELRNIEAIVYEILPDARHFTTILSKRDLETREKIYVIEMKIFETFKNEKFSFSVNYIHKPDELTAIIKNKNVLFQKRSIYASNR